jgi:uncharacterized membrane protein
MPVRDRTLLIALLLVNLAVKLLWLGRNELAHDEPFTVYWSQRPWGELWTMFATENNPPLHFVLTKSWSLFVPFEAAWLRVPSAVCSALVVWPLFLLVRVNTGPRVAVVATLLFTFSNYHYGFAHEVRGYALFTLLATTCMWQLWRIAHGAPRAIWWHALTATAMVYTHFFGWLLLGTELLMVLAVPALRGALRPWLKAIGITALAYLPYLGVFAQRAGTSLSQGTWLEAPQAEELYNMIWRWSNAPVVAVALLTAIIVAGVRSRMTSTAWRLGLIWAFVPLLGMFAVSFAAPMFLDRYLVYAAPGFALLAATSLHTAFGHGRWSGVPAALVVLAMAVTFTPWKPWRYAPSRVVAQVDRWCPDGCTVHVTPTAYQLTYASAKDIDLLKQDLSPLLNAHIETTVLDQRTELPTIVVRAAEAPSTTWRQALLEQYPRCDSIQADHKVWVYRFTYPPQNFHQGH